VQPSAPPARNAHVTSASRQLALQCAVLTSVTALLDFWHFPIQLIVLALIFAVGYFSHVSRHVTVTRLQVLCTELRAARARGGGNGGAFVSAMALLALAAAASAADASGLACR
jgi:hypothetical protein